MGLKRNVGLPPHLFHSKCKAGNFGWTPLIEILQKLCRFYNVDLELLLGWRDSQQTRKIVSSTENNPESDTIKYPSHSYTGFVEELDKQQKERQIEPTKKRDNNIHEYDTSIEITPEAMPKA